MLQALMITSTLAGITVMISLFFFLRGFYILIRGSCSLRGNLLRGKDARIAGLFLVGQIILGFAIYAPLFEAYHWGSVGDVSNNITGNIVQTFVFLSMVVLSYIVALRYAKTKNYTVELQPTTSK